MTNRASDHPEAAPPGPAPVAADATGAGALPKGAPKDVWDDDWDPFEAIPPINWRSPRFLRVVGAILAALVLAAASGFTYLRYIRPPEAYLWVETFPSPYLGELWWKMAGTDLYGLRWTPQGYRISPRAGQSAYIQFDTTDVVIPLTTWRTRLRSAIGSVLPPSADRLVLDLVVDRRGGYLTILERPPLHVQSSKSGLMITLPDANDPKQLRNVMLPDPSRPEGSTWQFERTGTTLAITIDGREVWKGAVPALDKTVRLGETRIDPEHDGTLLFRSVRYGGAR